jgi:hypothetical protein
MAAMVVMVSCCWVQLVEKLSEKWLRWWRLFQQKDLEVKDLEVKDVEAVPAEGSGGCSSRRIWTLFDQKDLEAGERVWL